MSLAHFRMLNNELLDTGSYVVPEQAPIIILDINPDVCIANNNNYTKHTINISRRRNFVRNGEECNLHKTVCCEVGLQLAEIK